jgi:ankyrin repeat protein
VGRRRGADPSSFPDREGEVRNLLLFDGVAPFEGPQDQEGNTLLHLVCAPKVAGWLIDRGLSLGAINNDGQTPLEYQAMPEDVRAFI